MRLDKDAIQQLKQEIGKPVILRVGIGRHEFDVLVETSMTPALELKMLKTIDYLNEANIIRYGEEIVGLFALVSTVTDIEWEGIGEDDLDTFVMLLNAGIINNILDAVPEELIAEMVEQMKVLQESLDLVLAEEVKANEEALRKAKLAKE